MNAYNVVRLAIGYPVDEVVNNSMKSDFSKEIKSLS